MTIAQNPLSAQSENQAHYKVWMATGKGVNLAAKVFCGNSYLRARGVLAGARRASANTPLARGAGNLGVVNGFVEGSVWR